MPIIHVATETEFNELVNTTSHTYIFVDFAAAWCGPCKRIAPKLEEMSDEDQYKDVLFLKVDVDELEDLSKRLKIRAMPTFLVFERGNFKRPLFEPVAGANEDKIRNLLKMATSTVVVTEDF
jgi:thioredoxin 1